MRVLISGSTGLIASALIPVLKREGHEVVRLVRREGSFAEETVLWTPEQGEIDQDKLTAIDAVINLSGENISAKRWNDQQKQVIRESRVKSTELLVDTMKSLEPMPSVFACASALGFYGDRGDDLLTENEAAGQDFFATITREWEEAAAKAADSGIRVVNMRFGLVLEAVLPRMLMPFKLGVGGRLGNGRQYMSWITREDITRAIYHMLTTDGLTGAVNASSPQPVTNSQFSKALGRVLGRPALTWTPAFALKILFGEVAESLVASIRMDSSKLLSSGFEFRHPEIEGAIRAALGRP